MFYEIVEERLFGNTMLNEAIILAGGLGTRLMGVISDIPKPMAPIGRVPFLTYLFQYLKKYEIKKIVLAVGYKYKVIERYFGLALDGIEIEYAIEKEPVGTGGGITKALQKISGEEVFLLNGDTFFDVDLHGLYHHHKLSGSDLTLSLKKMYNFERYGTVTLDDSRITQFFEKKKVNAGFINGGVYVLQKKLFDQATLPKNFSFETDIMEAFVEDNNFQGFKSKGYFIDIGIPQDYERAQKELPKLCI